MGLPSSARLRRAVPAPTGRTGQRSGRACTLRRHENAVPWTAPVSAPRHYAERRAGKGTPTSGRHSPPQAGGGKDPELGVLPGRDPVFSVVRTVGVHAFRCASRSGADRRSAFQAVGVVRPGGYGLRGGLFCWLGFVSPARLRRAVPTRGRRSLADGAIWTVGVPVGLAFSQQLVGASPGAPMTPTTTASPPAARRVPLSLGCSGYT